MTWLIVSVFIVFSVIPFFMWVYNKAKAHEQFIEDKFAGFDIIHLDNKVVLKAQLSRGYSQIQGLGTMVLTKNELYFKFQLINKDYAIPTAFITRCETTTRLKGVGTLRPMLKVNFKTDSGEDDALCFFIRDLSLWQEKLAQVCP